MKFNFLILILFNLLWGEISKTNAQHKGLSSINLDISVDEEMIIQHNQEVPILTKPNQILKIRLFNSFNTIYLESPRNYQQRQVYEIYIKPEYTSLKEYTYKVSLSTNKEQEDISSFSKIKKLDFDNGATSLHRACSLGNIDHVLKIINFGVNINSKNLDKNTPLIYAVSHQHYEIAKILIEQGAEVNTLNMFGESALFISIDHEYSLKIIKLLLAKGAWVDLPNQKGTTPLQMAQFYGYEDIKQLLISYGAIK